MRKPYIVLISLALLLQGFRTLGQDVSIRTSVSGTMTVCDNELEFTVSLKNLTGTALENVKLSPKPSAGITYVANSAMGMSEVLPLDINNVSFNVPSLPPNGEETQVKFRLTADCRLIEYLKSSGQTGTGALVNNKTVVEYTIGGVVKTQTEANGSESYNIAYADLEILVPEEEVTIAPYTKDSPVNRHIRIRNTGLGRTNKVTLTVKNDKEIEYKSLKAINGTTEIYTLNRTVINATTYQYEITNFAHIGNGDNYLDQNEEIVLLDEAKITAVNPAAKTDYIARWGCSGAVCNPTDQEAEFSVYIAAPGGMPVINFEGVNVSTTDFCLSDPAETDIGFYNNGSGNASSHLDAAYNFGFTIVINKQIFKLYDFYLVDQETNTRTNINSFVNVREYQGNDNVFIDVSLDNKFTDDKDGVTTGLDDLDQDGFFDDLPSLHRVKFAMFLKYEINTIIPFREDQVLNSYVVNINAKKWDGSAASTNGWMGGQFRIYYQDSDIVGPKDLIPDKNLVYKLSYTPTSVYRSEFNCKNETLESKLTLPSGLELLSVMSGNEIVNFIQTGNQVTFYHKVKLLSDITNLFQLQFKYNCINNTTSKESIHWDLYFVCDPVCSSGKIELTSRDFEVHAHCSPPSIIETTNFEVERTTLGWEIPSTGYYTYGEMFGGLPSTKKISRTTPGIELQSAYPRDAIRTYTKGKINGSSSINVDELHVRLSHTSLENTPLLNFKSAYIIVNQSQYSFPDSFSPILTKEEDIFYYDFKLPLGINGFPSSITSADELVLIADFVVSDGENIQRGVYEISNFRCNYYIVANNIKYESTSLGVQFKYLKPEVNFTPGVASSITCDGRVILGYIEAKSAYKFRRDFLNEFRPIWYVENILLDLPDGFVFDVSKKISLNQRVPLESVNFVVNENQANIYLDNNFPIFDTEYRNSFLTIQGYIKKDKQFVAKDPKLGLDFRQFSHVISYKKYGYLEDISNQQNKVVNITPGFYLYSDPQLSLTSNNVQEGYSSLISWPVQFCNTSIYSYFETPSNSWVSVELRSGDNSTILTGAKSKSGAVLPVKFYGPKDVTHPLGRHMFVYLGAIGRGTCSEFEILAQSQNCINDQLQTLDMYGSWDCSNYRDLTGFTGSVKDIQISKTYVHHQEIAIRYKTANMQWNVAKNAPESVPFCSAVPFEVDVISTQYADMHDVVLTLDLPEGVSVAPGTNISYKYPVGSSARVIAASEVTVSANRITILLDGLTGRNGIPGTRLADNAIKVLMSLTTGCGFDPYRPVVFTVTGKTNCGNEIVLTDGRKIYLNEVPLDDLDLQLTASSFAGCNSSGQLTINVSNQGAYSSTFNSLSILLPSGVSYGGVISGISSEPVSESFGDATVLTWSVPSGFVSANGSREIKLQTRLGSHSGNESELYYLGRAYRTYQATSCTEGTSCELTGTSAEGDFSQDVSHIFPIVDIISSSPVPACKGSEVELFAQTLGNCGGSGCIYSWQPTGSNLPAIVVAADADQTYTVTATNSIHCSNSAELYLAVEDKPNSVQPVEIVKKLDCSIPAVTLSANMQPGGLYQWFFNGAPLNGESSNEYIAKVRGEYSLTVKKDGCGLSSEKINVLLTQPPVASFELRQSEIEAGKHAGVRVTNYQLGNYYRWEWGDGKRNSSRLPLWTTHPYRMPGMYDIKLTVGNSTSCQTSSASKTIKVIRPLCSITIPNTLTGQFYLDKETGKIIFRNEDCPGEADFGCIEGLPAPGTLKDAISATTLLYSDRWDIVSNYNYKGGSSNDFENGKAGKWRPSTTFSYNTALSAEKKNYKAGTFIIGGFDWKDPQNNDPMKWLRMSSIENYSPHGEAIQNRNALDIASVTKFGYNYTHPYLVAQNASYEDVLFESFENTYTVSGATMFEDLFSFNTTKVSLSSELAHSGKYSIRLTDNWGGFPLKEMQLSEQVYNSGLVIKFWIYSLNNQQLALIANNTSFSLVSGAGTIADNLKGKIISSCGNWNLFEFRFNNFTITPGETYRPVLKYWGEENIYIDDLVMSPQDAKVNTSVYDKETFRLIATFDEQHYGLFYQYNEEGQLVRKLIESEKGIRTIEEVQYNIPKVNR